jgi:glycosyltransferase involved in cell wall biosynthesis
MRILFIAHSFKQGGAEKCLYQLVKFLQGSNIDCMIMGPAGGPYLAEYGAIAVRGKPVRSGSLFRNRKTLGLFRNLAGVLISTFQVAAQIIVFRPHLVFTNTSSVVSGALAAKATGTPHIWHMHENYRMVEDAYFLPLPILRRMYDRTAEKIIFVSGPALKSFYPEGNPRAEIIHNGVDVGLFNSEDRAGKYPLQIRKILFLGSLEHRKGPDTLIKAFVAVRAGFPQVELHLYGNGEAAYLEFLKNLVLPEIAAGVKFRGYCHDISRALPDYDLMVVPSRAESFSLVTIEAMLAGLPVIATRCGGPEELLQDGVTGMLVEPGDADELAQAILTMMRNPARAFAMGKEAKLTAIRKFDLNRQLQSILNLLKRTIKE